MYRIAIDYPAAILKVEVTGLFTPDSAAAFSRELVTTLRKAEKQVPHLKILIDLRRAPVQQLAAFNHITQLGDEVKSRPPTAIVASSNLARMQAERGVRTHVDPASGGEMVHTFMCMDAALAWLQGNGSAAPMRRAS